MLAVVSPAAPAAIRYFVGPDDGNWNNANNWSATAGGAGGAGVPGDGDVAVLTRNGPIFSSKNARFDAFYTPETNSLSELRLYDAGSGTFTLSMNLVIFPTDPPLVLNPILRADNEYVGFDGGQGVVNQFAGVNSVKFNLALGGEPGSSATYNLSGGTLTTGNAVVLAGPSATFNHSGGTHNANQVFLGSSAGAGKYNLSGTGVLNATGLAYVGSDGGAGTFTQTGGAHNGGSLHLGNPSKPADSTYALSGGTLEANLTIGTTGKTATFTQSGGVATLTNLTINDPGPSGAATYHLQAGALAANLVQNRGTFNQAAGALKVGVSFDNYGAATLGAGQDWAAGGALRGHEDSVTTVNSDLGAGAAFPSVSADGAAAVTFNRPQRLNSLGVFDAAAVTLAASPMKNRAIYAANGLTIASGPASTARIDLTNNGMIIHAGYNAAQTRAQIVRGYHSGDWQGPGITSSTAAADLAKNTALGYFVNEGTYSLFQGMAVAVGDVLVRYTLYGDANLSTTVDFEDLVKVAQNYNAPAGDWFKGDFTYDGVVDFNDLVKLAQNYNAALPAAPVPGAPAGFDADLARALAAVPEPGGAATVIACSVGGLAFRRRVPA